MGAYMNFFGEKLLGSKNYTEMRNIQMIPQFY